MNTRDGNIMRKLVSIQTIKELVNIDGADKIQLAKMTDNNWQCVVKKGEFKPGDKGLYFEIDSILPHTDNPETSDARWEFLRPRGFRIKTMKLRGALSQGLLMPITSFPEIKGDEEDLAVKIGVVKYEPPATFKNGDAKGNFPTHIIPKTDEERIQNIPEIVDEMANFPYFITVKVDGTSTSMFYDKEEDDGVISGFNACSRNLTVKDGDNVYYNIAKKYNIPDVLKRSPEYAIQGEIAGPGIQKNRLGLKDIELFVYNIWDRNTNKYVDFELFLSLCDKWKLQTVPIDEVGDSFTYTFDDLLEKADGFYNRDLNLIREGIVIRPKFEKYSPILKGRLSFKVISNAYLLKYGE